MIIRQALLQSSKTLHNANIETARLDSQILLSHIINKDKLFLLINDDFILSQKQIKQFFALIERRVKHEPVAKIIGYKEFWGLEFYTNQYTLDPRPDSELLIETALKYLPDKEKKLNILDIGTGTGCLILSLLSEYNNAQGIAIDCCNKALQLSSKNAKKLNLNKQIKYIKSHWLESIPKSAKFDLIISNPPYITTDEYDELGQELEFDPQSALISKSHDGLDAYTKIAEQAFDFLTKDGYIMLEIGRNMENSVTNIMKQHHFKHIDWYKDIANINRCGVFSI